MLKRFMTYDEYETLENAAWDTEVTDDYEVPDEEDILKLADSEDGLMPILIAMINAPTKQYESFVKKVLRNSVELFDTKREVLKAQKKYGIKPPSRQMKETDIMLLEMSEAQTDRMKAVIDAMQFDPAEYFPTKEDVAYLVQERFKEEKEAVVAYLTWLCMKDIPLSKEEQEIKTYIRQLLPILVKEV